MQQSVAGSVGHALLDLRPRQGFILPVMQQLFIFPLFEIKTAARITDNKSSWRIDSSVYCRLMSTQELTQNFSPRRTGRPEVSYPCNFFL